MKRPVVLVIILILVTLLSGCMSASKQDGTAPILTVKTPMPGGTSVLAAPKIATVTPTTTASATSEICGCASNKYNCDDFSGRAAAQECYDHCKAVGAGDVHGLDRDKDGVVCESS